MRSLGLVRSGSLVALIYCYMDVPRRRRACRGWGGMAQEQGRPEGGLASNDASAKSGRRTAAGRSL